MKSHQGGPKRRKKNNDATKEQRLVRTKPSEASVEDESKEPCTDLETSVLKYSLSPEARD